MSELNEMSCAEFADVAAELALGVLTGRERAEALAHLDHCESCRESVRQLTLTGEGLLALLPSSEPPPGFETRVMERLGLPVPAPSSQRRAAHHRRERGKKTASRFRPGSLLRPAGRAGSGSRPGPGARPGERRVGRGRRVLAAAAVVVAVVVAGLGGWGLHASTSSPAPASVPLSSAPLLTASHRTVGEVFFYNGDPRWMYMSVALDDGASRRVVCQLESTGGKLTAAGSFRVVDGYGSWGSPAGVTQGTITGARLLAADGTVLATATLPGYSELRPS